MAATLRTRTGQEFSGLPRDGQANAIQAANYFTTIDASTSPKSSPLAYSGATIYALTIPQGAVQVALYPSTDLRISEVSNVANYDIIAAGTKEIVSCAELAAIYCKEDSADGSLRFRFIFV